MSKRRGVYNEELVEKMQCGIAGLFNDWYNNAGICGGCAIAEEQTTESQQTEGQASEPQADELQQQEEQPAEKEQTTEEQQSVSENNQGEVVQEQEEAKRTGRSDGTEQNELCLC